MLSIKTPSNQLDERTLWSILNFPFDLTKISKINPRTYFLCQDIFHNTECYEGIMSAMSAHWCFEAYSISEHMSIRILSHMKFKTHQNSDHNPHIKSKTYQFSITNHISYSKPSISISDHLSDSRCVIIQSLIIYHVQNQSDFNHLSYIKSETYQVPIIYHNSDPK